MSTCDEPDLWQKDLTGAIELWIDVGLPDEKLIRRACGRASQVFIYTYGGRIADTWWNQCRGKLEQIKNLTVSNLPKEASQAIAADRIELTKIEDAAEIDEERIVNWSAEYF